jgi:hypothetical protein
MPSCEYDLRFLKAGLEQLREYIHSDAIYWPLGAMAPYGEPPYPQLTLGWLLLSRLRVGSTCLDPAQKMELDRIGQTLVDTRSQWLTAWRKKTQAEFHARLNLWRDFLEDYRKNPPGNYRRYSYEVSRRVLLQLLKDESDHLPDAELEVLDLLDQMLRIVFVPADFIWDNEIVSSFPKTTFWYLYGHLARGEERNSTD